MTFDARLVIVGLAMFFATGAIAALLVPLLLRRRRSADAAARSSALFRLRLVPVAVSVSALFLTTISFIDFEPREQPEGMGVVFISFAALAAALLIVAAVRLVAGHLATRRIRQLWATAATPVGLPHTTLPAVCVDAEFPIVAVVGIWRPQLVVAKSVLKCCSEDELRAIVAHEESHVARRDNLRRWILTSLPDVLSWLPISRSLAAGWDQAAEEAADDGAISRFGTNRLHLANALIRVARLVPKGREFGDIPASALYRGDGLVQRVNRLLEPPTVMTRPRLHGSRFVFWVAAGAGSLLALRVIHEIVEIAVTFLP